MPRLKRNLVDAAEIQAGIPLPRKQKSTGPAKDSLEPAVIVPADKVPPKEWADQMQMNEEIVTIRIHETNDKLATQIPDLYINGIPQRFIRGQEQNVRWKYVELLARCVETTYTQEKYRDAEGIEAIRNVPHTALRYPFELLNVPSKFHDRLRAVRAEVG